MYFDREERGSTERICNEVSSLCSPAGSKALTVFSCQREERSKVPGLILRQSSGKMIKYKKDKRQKKKKIMAERISNVLRATNSNVSPCVPAPYTCASAGEHAIPSALTHRRLPAAVPSHACGQPGRQL